MGSIIAKISKKLGRCPKETKLIIVGLDGAGKTTVLYKLKLGEIKTTVPTIGFNVETLKYKNILFKMWDIGGQEKIRFLWQNYYCDAKGIIFVIDSGDIERIDNDCNEHGFAFVNSQVQQRQLTLCNSCSVNSCTNSYATSHNSISNLTSPSRSNSYYYYNQHCARDELKQMLSHSTLSQCPVLIFANKQDLPNAMTVQEIIERLELNSITDRKWHVQPTCAISGEGLIEGLTWLSKNVNNIR